MFLACSTDGTTMPKGEAKVDLGGRLGVGLCRLRIGERCLRTGTGELLGEARTRSWCLGGNPRTKVHARLQGQGCVSSLANSNFFSFAS